MVLDIRLRPRMSEGLDIGFDSRDSLDLDSVAVVAQHSDWAAADFETGCLTPLRSRDKTARHHDYSRHKMYKSYESEAS